MNRIALLALVALSLVACTDEGVTDDGADDGMASPMTGAWSVTQGCVGGPDCATGWPGVTRAVIGDSGRGDRASIRWSGGASAFDHAATIDGTCAVVPAGTDAGRTRGGYTLCIVDGGLAALVTWDRADGDGADVVHVALDMDQ